MTTPAMPTADDFILYDSADEKVAAEHFLGKSVEEAEKLFAENSMFYQEDLMWMGTEAFAYYFPAVVKYVKSKAAEGDDAIISALYDIIMFRFSRDYEVLSYPSVYELIMYVLDNYEKFDVDEEAYGNVRSKYQELKTSVTG